MSSSFQRSTTMSLLVAGLIFVCFLLVSSAHVFAKLQSVDNTTQQIHLTTPPDVSLKDYNITEFIILVSNVTNNLTLAQDKIVLTNYSKIKPGIVVSLRALFILFNIWLFISAIAFRNFEPVKSKFLFVIVLIIVNSISHIQGAIENLPIMRLYFESYWNKFIDEKKLNSIDAFSFYMNNLDSKGFPNWMRGYASFENGYCFFNSYVFAPLVTMGLALYSIQILKLMLLLFLKDKVDSMERYWQDFKQKQLEKLKSFKKQETNRIEVKTVPKSISDQDPTKSTSQSSLRPSITSNDTSIMDDTISIDTDGSDEDGISLDGLSERGRFLNVLKTIIKYKVIEIFYIIFWGIVTYIVLSARIFLSPADTTLEPIFNNSWKSIAGYCNYTTRVDNALYSLIIGAILFFIVPIFLAVDCIVSLVKYVKVKRENKEKGVKTENFLVYHFYETDPFVYRTESLLRFLFDLIALIIYLVLVSTTNTDGTVAGTIASLAITVLLHFFGGTFFNPGITIYKSYYNFILMKKRSNNSQSPTQQIQSLQELMSSPVSSFSIDYVISRRVERELFHEFLKKEFSVENLLFVEDLQKLRKINERHARSKVSKVKEMVKLYLSDNSSVFEVNIPSKIIQTETKDFRDLIQLLNQHGIQLNSIPRSVKEASTTRYFPQLQATEEDQIRILIENLSKSNIFSTLNFEVYKNLMDSFHRFKHSRKWVEFVKANKVQI